MTDEVHEPASKHSTRIVNRNRDLITIDVQFEGKATVWDFLS